MGRAMRRQSGKIRLQQGVQNPGGTGYGLAHIEARHGREIRGVGFANVQEFVAHIIRNMQQIWQVPRNKQLLITARDTSNSIMYVQLEAAKEGDFYRINTAFPVKRSDYEIRQGMKKIWDGSDPAVAVTGQRPAFAATPEAALTKATSGYPNEMSSQDSPTASDQIARSLPQSRCNNNPPDTVKTQAPQHLGTCPE